MMPNLAAYHVEEDTATEKILLLPLGVCINHLVQGNRVILVFSVILHIYMMFTQWFNMQYMASHGTCALVSAATP